MNENNFYHFQIVILPLLRRVKIDKACEVDIGYDARKGSFLSTVPRDFFPPVER